MKGSLCVLAALGLAASASPVGTLEERQFGNVGITANDINGACKDVTFIFARGTFELGNMGNIIGGAFATQLGQKIRPKSLAVQGVDYAADVGGYLLGGDNAGANKMRDHAQNVATKCPNTKIILSGYSQGGQVTHMAVDRINAATKERISAIVIFGDPMNGKGFPGISNDKVKIFCDVADLICAHLPLPIGAHLGYGSSAGPAATFAASKV